MKTSVRVALNTSAEEAAKLRQLQAVFAKVCNTIAPLVQKTKVWNRVALHHMAYKPLREQFPQLGSQMVCNAIYSVSRHSRLLYQHPASPFNVGKLGKRPLPLLRFTEQSPVYFDRHTLSIKDGQLSLFTLGGRMRFQVGLRHEDELSFKTKKLREVALARPKGAENFELTFVLTEKADEAQAADETPTSGQVPEYMTVEEMHERT
jgi:hypothetical protein